MKTWAQRLLAALARIPLAVRVALVAAPVILAAQILTFILMRESRPMVGIVAGDPPPMFPLQRPPPVQHPGQPTDRDAPHTAPGPAPDTEATGNKDQGGLPPPGARLEIWRLPDSGAWPLSPAELEKLQEHAPPDARRAFRGGFRTGPPRPPWRGLLAVFVVTALLLWLATRWVTRPLARLADAAESLGRDVDQAPLAEGGPPEVRRAALAFNRMQDRLRRFLRGRSDALLAMSHDLKTPITRLQLRLELLPEDVRAGIAEDVNLLQTRVEHALNFMRGVHRDEPMQRVDLDALIAAVVERYQDSGAQISLGGRAGSLQCRPAQIERALDNLIDNALQHAGHAEIEVGQTPQGVRVGVRDRGPGVPQDALQRLAEPFFRVDASRNRDNGGTGLGLAIVKDIVESHGGYLSLANRSGGGFEACVELPRR